ncbi:MAG: hypothetical protein HY282_06150 [Nitrospirae bacterium]|nr:hypothetical protein [Candidatus Manganitrophaceae bacterium]
MSITSIYTSPGKQLQKWRELNDWIKKQFAKDAIPEEAFKQIEPQLKGLTSKSRIFYGFGDNGQGQADPFLTGNIFATYLTGKHHLERSRYIDFYPTPPDPSRFDFYRPKIKMRDGAAPRPKGFYIKELLPKDYEEGIGTTYKEQSPNEVRKQSPWGFGPEGFEFLAVEEVYLPLLAEKKVPVYVLGDYSVSPYGEGDFSSTMFIGAARDKVELGCTNSRDNIAKYRASHFA